MRFTVIAMLFFVTLLALACGGGDNDNGDGDLLTLRNVDIAAEDLRTAYRRLFVSDVGTGSFCASIRGLTADEVVDVLTDPGADPDRTPDPALIDAGGTAKAQQTPNPDDAAIAAQIIIDECERIAGD